MSIIAAVVIGGTQIRTAAYVPDCITPFAQKRTPTRTSEPGVFDRLMQANDAAWQLWDVAATGIASPGPLDPSIWFFGGSASQADLPGALAQARLAPEQNERLMSQ